MKKENKMLVKVLTESDTKTVMPIHNNYKYKVGLFIGRMQPIHRGHAMIIREALLQCERVVVAIGSAQESPSFDNPFDMEVRRMLIEKAIPTSRIVITGIADRENYKNDSSWGEYLLNTVFYQTGYKPEAVFMGGEDKSKSWFEKSNVVVHYISRETIRCSGTEVREALLKQDYETFKEKMPSDIWSYYDLLSSKINSCVAGKKQFENAVKYVQKMFRGSAEGKAIIGISGGKDSTITAGICVAALGANRVIGIMMPNGVQNDIEDARAVCKLLGIEAMTINVVNSFNSICDQIDMHINKTIRSGSLSQVKTNLPARLRMSTLYTVASLYPDSRVINTGNASEAYVGYATKGADSNGGDISILGKLTVREILEIGTYMSEVLKMFPIELVKKPPADGMCGKTDEGNLGFTYEELDSYLLDSIAPDWDTLKRIEDMHKATRHKYEPIPVYDPTKEY